MINIDDIKIEINTQIAEQNYYKASELYIYLITQLKFESSPLLSEIYYDYGLFLFDLQEYELCIRMLESSYCLNNKKEEIINFIYDAFIIPNEDEFKNSYESSILNYKSNFVFNKVPRYNELTLDFIPVSEDKYFIFDKNLNQFEGIIDFSENGMYSYKTKYFNDEFSNIIIASNWNINGIHDYILSAKDRQIYYLSDNPLKSISFLKLPNIFDKYINNLIFVESLNVLQSYFHTDTSLYLPRLVYANHQFVSDKINKLLEEEHNYRLTPEGRNTSNILLSISIPSYNRGHRALKNILNSLKLPFDAEIEFVLTNNCSDKNTEGYEEIASINDSRINYFKFPENPGKNNNFCQAIHMSNGKFSCLLSDEDLINLSSVTHYLSILKNNPNLSFLKGRGVGYYKDNSGETYLKGKDALLHSFLTTNYISGLIFKTHLFHKLKLYSWTAERMTTNYAVRSYAHTCWTVFYSMHGDYIEDTIPLFSEGFAENDAPLIDVIQESSATKVLIYGTVEKRINQHNGFIDVLNQVSNFFDKITLMEAYKILCRKTFFLVSLVKSQYLSIGEDWNSICLEVSNCCVDGIAKMRIPLTKDEQNILLNEIYRHYLYYINNN